MAKVYIANTPLILEDDSGKQYRVEAGEVVELTPEQYESVAAHVTATLTTGEELDAQQAEAQEQMPSDPASVDATQLNPATEPEVKPKTQRKTKVGE
ncbi:phage protein [Neisseria weaveri]|nr:phage protein [Neisseria weaveri]